MLALHFQVFIPFKKTLAIAIILPMELPTAKSSLPKKLILQNLKDVESIDPCQVHGSITPV